MRMDDDDVLEKCWRCCSGRAHASNAICFCDFCGYGVHQRCDSAPLGQLLLPGENDEWVCGFCRQKSSAARSKWRKILSADTPPSWQIWDHQPLQLLNDDGPSPDYRHWVSTMLKRNTDFITLFGWFDTFGDVIGTGKLSFQDLDQMFAAPTSSGILREVHVQLLTCAGKKPHRDTWFRTLLDFMEDNEEAFSDATKLAKALSTLKAQAGLSAAGRAASALAEALEDEEDVPLGKPSACNSSSAIDIAETGPAEECEDIQQKRMWGAEARKSARAARAAAQGTHGTIAGTSRSAKARGAGSTGGDSESDSEGEASDSEGGRDWNYFTLPFLVRVSLLRCLCDELLCIDTKSNRKLADFLRVKVATRDTSTVPEGGAAEKGESSKTGKGKAAVQKVEKEEDEAMAPEQLRSAIQPIAQVPLYTSSSILVAQSSDQPPVPDYVHTLEQRARQREGDTVAGLAGEDVNRPTVPPGRVYHLPSYLAEAALAASPCNTVHSGSSDHKAAHVPLELLHSPRRKESKSAGASSTVGTASMHAALSTVLAVPRSILSVQPSPASKTLLPGAQDTDEHVSRRSDQGKNRKGRAVIDDEEDEERQEQGDQSPEAELSDVEEVKDDTPPCSDADMEQDEEALPALPQDAEDARAMRYYFFEDTTGAFRLIRMKADLPLECPPGSLHARKHLVVRAHQAAQATVQHEQMMKRAAEEARARAEAEEIAAKLAAEKAVADAEARRKAFFKVAGIAAPLPVQAPSLPAPKNENAAADIVVVDAAEPVQGGVLTTGSKRPAAEISADPSPSPAAALVPTLPPPVPPVSSAPLSSTAAATQDAKKVKTTAASKAQPPPGQKTLFQMFSKPKAAPAAAAGHGAGIDAPAPTPSPPEGMAPSAGTASSCTPIQPSAALQHLLTVAPVPAESVSSTVSTADVVTAMKEDHEGGRRSVSPSVPIPQELKQTEAAADDSEVMLVDSPLQSVPATTACTGIGVSLSVQGVAGGAGMEGKGGKRKPAAKAEVQPESTIPQLEVLQQLPGLVYTSIPASSLRSMDSSPLAGLSTVSTLADSLPALEGVIAELSQSTSLWERHVAKRLQADALPRARALMKRSERQKRRHVADLSSWAYQPSASTAAAPAHDGAYAGRTRGRRPVSYDVDAAMDKLLGVA